MIHRWSRLWNYQRWLMSKKDLRPGNLGKQFSLRGFNKRPIRIKLLCFSAFTFRSRWIFSIADNWKYQRLTTSKTVWYLDLITIDFDNCRIAENGKVYAPGTPSKLGAILQRITNLTEVRILSMYQNLGNIWFSVMISQKSLFSSHHNILNILWIYTARINHASFAKIN